MWPFGTDKLKEEHKKSNFVKEIEKITLAAENKNNAASKLKTILFKLHVLTPFFMATETDYKIIEFLDLSVDEFVKSLKEEIKCHKN